MNQEQLKSNIVYLQLNGDNIRSHIEEANLANDYHLKAAALASNKAQKYSRMLELNTQTLKEYLSKIK